MPALFGDERCLDPQALSRECQEQGLPLGWVGLPNSYFCPLGVNPGRGWILLLRSQLDRINQNNLYNFYLETYDQARKRVSSVTHRNLLFVKAQCLTPGAADDTKSAYLCELADRRHLYTTIPIDKAYNVRSCPGSATYYSATLNSGTPWTWQTLVTDIWNTLGTSRLGGNSTLPFTPDGTPEGFDFYGGYALFALGAVLERLGCALAYDSIADSFSIVRVAATDALAGLALAAHSFPDR